MKVIKRDGIELHLKEGDGEPGEVPIAVSNGDPVYLNGDRMTIVDNADGSATFTYDDKGTGRSCGGCSLCCKLIGVASLGKPPGQKCRHSKVGKGCAIYDMRPKDCRTWSCRWLADFDTAGMPRPDRCHYVIDLTWEKVMARDQEDTREIPALQVWVDPAFPEAAKAPELRRFMVHVAEKYGAATVLRFEKDATIVFPPQFSTDGLWREMRGTGFVDDGDGTRRHRFGQMLPEARP